MRESSKRFLLAIGKSVFLQRFSGIKDKFLPHLSPPQGYCSNESAGFCPQTWHDLAQGEGEGAGAGTGGSGFQTWAAAAKTIPQTNVRAVDSRLPHVTAGKTNAPSPSLALVVLCFALGLQLAFLQALPLPPRLFPLLGPTQVPETHAKKSPHPVIARESNVVLIDIKTNQITK